MIRWSRLSEFQPNDLSQRLDRFAVVSVIVTQPPQPEILFIRRKINPQDPWSGQIGLPGGKREKDETHFQTAIRETQEEVGLTLNEINYKGQLDDIQSRSQVVHTPFYIRPLVFEVPQKIEDLLIDPEEVDAYFWISLDEILSSKNQTNYIYNLQNKTYQLPAVQLPTKDLMWGLTYKILTQFFETTLDLPKAWKKY